MDVLALLALLAVLLAAPCFVQLVLWTAYSLLSAISAFVPKPRSVVAGGRWTNRGDGVAEPGLLGLVELDHKRSKAALVEGTRDSRPQTASWS